MLFFWFWLSSSHPDEDPTITEQEKMVISGSPQKEPLLGHVQKETVEQDPTIKPSKTLSWQSLTAIPVLASYICVFCGAWSLYIQWNYSPLYLHSVLGLALENAAMYQVLPTLVGIVVSQFGAYLIEKMSDSGSPNGTFTVLQSRRIIFTIGFLTQATAFGAMGYVANVNTAILLYVLGTSLNTLSVPTYYVSVSDMAPYHSGVLMSIANGLGGISAIVSPIVAGVLLDAGGCQSDLPDGAVQSDECLMAWKTIFFITAGVLVLAVAIFDTLGTTSPKIGKSGHLIETEAFLNASVNKSKNVDAS